MKLDDVLECVCVYSIIILLNWLDSKAAQMCVYTLEYT